MSVKTLKDYLVEASLYDYSQESYELMKEASEIDLAQAYINSRRFVMDGGPEAIMESFGVEGVEDTFFTESMQSDESLETLESLDEKVQEKWNAFKTKVKEAAKRVINAMITFFNRMKAGAKDQQEKIKGILDNLKTLEAKKITPEVKEQVKSVVEKAIASSKAPISASQPAGVKKNFAICTDAGISAKLGAALSLDRIKCDITEETKFALSQGQLKGFFESIPSASGKSAKALRSRLDGYCSDNMKNGIQIQVSENSLTQVIQALMKAKEDLEQKEKDVVDSAQDSGTADTEDNRAYNELISDCNKVSVHSIKLYTAVRSYRTAVIAGLAPIVSQLKKSAGGSSKAAEKEEE